MRKIYTDLKKNILFKMSRRATVQTGNVPLPSPLPINQDCLVFAHATNLPDIFCVLMYLKRMRVNGLTISMSFASLTLKPFLFLFLILDCVNLLESDCFTLRNRCGEYYVDKYCAKNCNRKY